MPKKLITINENNYVETQELSQPLEMYFLALQFDILFSFDPFGLLHSELSQGPPFNRHPLASFFIFLLDKVNFAQRFFCFEKVKRVQTCKKKLLLLISLLHASLLAPDF